MDEPDHITVASWQYTAPPTRPSHRTHVRVASRTVGVLGTLLLHAMLLKSLGTLIGGHPITMATGSGLYEESLVLLPILPTTQSGDLIIEGVVSVPKLPDTVPRLLPPPPLAVQRLAADHEAQQIAGELDQEVAQLEEIYNRQIIARIERVWDQPSISVTDATLGATSALHCQVQLEQDPQGNVKEVLLPNCNGPISLRDSLMLAIKSASPLPAPPDPRVFRTTLVLRFDTTPKVVSN
jgi:hypothetical protein